LKALLAVVAILLADTAQASNFTGTLVQLQTLPSPTTPGNTRVGIQTGGTNSCTGSGYPSWYSFDLPNSGVAQIWQAILLAAISAGKTVAIYGSGTCDAYGIEIVSVISAQP
jgi:hypothetical protein